MNRYVNPMLALQVREQIEHPRLHRNIQRRCGFVEDEQLGFARQGPRDADPLALARRTVRADIGRRTTLAGRRVRAARRLAPGGASCRPPAGVPAAARRSPCRSGARGLSVENGSWNTRLIRLRSAFSADPRTPNTSDVPNVRGAGVGFDQAGERGGHRRLTRTRLADEAQRGAAPDLKRQILDRVDDRLADRRADVETHIEAVDVEQDASASVGGAGGGPVPPTSGRAASSSRV